MIKKTLLVIVLLIAGFLIFAATRPAAFRYTRSLAIAAPPEAIFPRINDLHQFQTWNSWAKTEPDAKITYSGPEAGVGAAYDWVGQKIGEGAMTITESKPAELLRARMDFRKPFEATNITEFTLKPEGGKTLVSWSLYGDNNFLGKVMNLLIDCDKMCGDEFEKGLASLKELAETPAAPQP